MEYTLGWTPQSNYCIKENYRTNDLASTAKLLFTLPPSTPGYIVIQQCRESHNSWCLIRTNSWQAGEPRINIAWWESCWEIQTRRGERHSNLGTWWMCRAARGSVRPPRQSYSSFSKHHQSARKWYDMEDNFYKSLVKRFCEHSRSLAGSNIVW